MERDKNATVFVQVWLCGILMSILPFICCVIFFARREIAVAIVSALWALLWALWFVLLIPHSFSFDDEKITAIYVFKTKTVRYKHITRCGKEESGIRTYPWGNRYYIIADKPSCEEIKIPSTPRIDLKIKEYIYNNPNVKIS